MFNPIEVNHRNTLAYVKLLKRAVRGLGAQDVPRCVAFSIGRVKEQIRQVEDTYKAGATTHLVRYYTNKDGAADQYWAFINAANIPGILGCCVRRLEFISKHIPTIAPTITKCAQYSMTVVVRKLDVSKCSCGATFIIAKQLCHLRYFLAEI